MKYKWIVFDVSTSEECEILYIGLVKDHKSIYPINYMERT
jgi:hypothetical protein